MTKLQDTIAAIREMYYQGHSVAEIIHFLGVSSSLVTDTIKSMRTGDQGADDYDSYGEQ
jgi:hypothetical protein